MGWFFQLSIETGADESLAHEVARHFEGYSFSITPTLTSVCAAGIIADSDRNWWVIVAPSGLSACGVNNVTEALDMTIAGQHLYKRLLTAPPFRYAIAGIETEQFRTWSELRDAKASLFPKLHGLVMTREIWEDVKRPTGFVEFRTGYLWRPYAGETFAGSSAGPSDRRPDRRGLRESPGVKQFKSMLRWLCVIVFLLLALMSLIVHGSTFFNYNPSAPSLGWWYALQFLSAGALIVALLSFGIDEKRGPGPLTRSFDRVIAYCFFGFMLYAVFNFIFTEWFWLHGGSTQIIKGDYTIGSHGYNRIINREQFMQYAVYEARLGSGHLMAFFLFGATALRWRVERHRTPLQIR